MANYDQCGSLSWSQVSQNDVMASDVATDQCQKEICSWRHQCFYQRAENDSTSPVETTDSSSAPSLSSAAVSLWTMSHLASEESDRFAWPTFGHRQTENNRVDYCQWSVDRTEDDDPSANEFLSAYDDQRHFGGCNGVAAAGKFNFYDADDDGSSRMEFYVNDLSTALDGEQDSGPCVNDQNVYRPFPLLETIIEETDEDLTNEMEVSSEPSESSSPSCSSGPWGWGWGLLTSDDDSCSVIHMPLDQKSPGRLYLHAGSHGGAVDISAECRRMDNPECGEDELGSLSGHSSPSTSESEWSERDQEVPKKRRKLDQDDGSESADDETRSKAETEGSRSPSVTESLIQFEALEKEIGDLCQSCDDDDPFAFCSAPEPESMVFRISATTQPFEEDDETTDDHQLHLEDLRPPPSSAPSSGDGKNSVHPLDLLPQKQEKQDDAGAEQTEESGYGSTGERRAMDFYCRNKSDGATVSTVPVSALLLLRAWSSLDAFSRGTKEAGTRQEEEDFIRADDVALERPERSRSACDLYAAPDRLTDGEKVNGRCAVAPPPPVRSDSAVRTAAKAALIDGHFAVEREWKKLSAQAERSEIAYRYGDFGGQEPHQDDEDDEEDRQWEPDGYLGSDSDDYQRESNSNSQSSDSESEYSAERGDRFDESHFGLAFCKERTPVVSAGSVKMRSYRSFDSLNLLALSSTADEEAVVPERASFILQSRNSLTSVRENEEDEADSAGSSNSHNESNSNSPVDRSSPEEFVQSYGTRRRNDRRRVALQRSVEALSEDSGYGDSAASSGLLNSPENSRGTFTSDHSPLQNMCGPDDAPQASDSHPEEADDRLAPETDAEDDDDDEYESAVEELEDADAKAIFDDGRLDCPESSPDEFKGADHLSLSSTVGGWQSTFSREEPDQGTKSVACVTNQEETRHSDSDGMLTESRADVSALLQRRKPRSRPAPLSLKEAEEFLILDATEQSESAGADGTDCGESYGHQAAAGGEEACDVTIRHRRRMESSGYPSATWESPRCGLQGPAEKICMGLQLKDPLGSHSNAVLDTNHTSVTCADPLVSCVHPTDRNGRCGSVIKGSDSASNSSGHVGSGANLAPAKFSPLRRQIGNGRETSQQQEMEPLGAGEGALLLQPSSSCGDQVKPHANLPHLAAGSSCAPDEQSAAAAAAATSPASHGSADWAENVTRCLWPSSSSSWPSVGHPTPSESVAKVRNDQPPEMSVADQQDLYPPRVVLKRYARHDVEVYLSKQQPSKSSPSVVGFTPKSSTPPASGGKGVHFSPVVSAVNWRESYLDDEDTPDEDPEESVRAHNQRNSQQHPDQVQKVRVVSAKLVPASPSNVHKVQVVTTCPVMAVPEDPAVHQPLEIPTSMASLASTTASGGASESECEAEPASKSRRESAGAESEDVDERGRSKKKEKAPLFQRFSLARLSARMSATFSRSTSEAKRQATSPNRSKKDAVADSAGPEAAAVGCVDSCKTTNSGQKSPAEKENGHDPDVGGGKERKSSGGNGVVDTVHKVKDKIKGKDKNKEKDKSATNVDKKEAKNKNKAEGSGRNFFSRKFYRSSSTPPAVNRKSLSSQEATADAASDVGSPCSPGEPQSSAEQVMTDRPDDGAGVEPTPPQGQHVAEQPDDPPEVTVTAATTTETETRPPPLPVKSSSLTAMRHPATKFAEGEDVAPIPPPRNAAKPPLPPQVRPRTFHARKLHYLVTEKGPESVTSPGGADSQLTAPPVPVISSVALQLALEHFKETARRERERLAKSVPDLVAMDQQTRRDNRTPTSPSIDRGVTSAVACTPPPTQPSSAGRAASRTQASSEDVTATRDSRCRARQAALSRASSVESAWNATLSKAALSLSRRNIASSNSNISTTTAGGGARPAAAAGPAAIDGPDSGRVATTNADGHVDHSVGTGLLETNLDEDAYETNLDQLIQNLEIFAQSYRSASYNAAVAAAAAAAAPAAGCDQASSAYYSADKKYKSMLNLGSSSAPVSVQPDIDMMDATGRCMADPSRAKSMEFLLDDENKSTIQIPENELKKAGERQMSEHELRIQRSLQKLNVPDWFKNAPKTPVNGSAALSGGLRRRDIHGSSLGSSLRGGGWSAFSRDSKTSSMTSLGSLASRSATPTRVIIPTRVRPPSDWRQVKSSRESLLPLSPSTTGSAVVSPSISSSSPLQGQQPQHFQWSGPASIHSTGSYATSGTGSSFQRWGSGRLSYGCPSPAPSTSSAYRSSLLSNRTPVYLGWRSQEKLNGSAALSTYQSPAERLASSLKKNTPAGSPEAPTVRIDASQDPEPVPAEPVQAVQSPPEVQEDVRSSIREVTSAIVHYVTENASPGQRSPASVHHPAGRIADETIREFSRSPSPRRQRCVWLESSFVGPAPAPVKKAPEAAPSPPRSPSPGRGVSPSRLANHNYRLINERPACTSDVTVNVTQPRSDLVLNTKFRPVVVSVTAGTPTGDSGGDMSAVSGRMDGGKGVSTATLDDVLNSLLGLAPEVGSGGGSHRADRCGILPRPTSQPSFQHSKQRSANDDRHPTSDAAEIRSCGDLRCSRSNGTLSSVAGFR